MHLFHLLSMSPSSNPSLTLSHLLPQTPQSAAVDPPPTPPPVDVIQKIYKLMPVWTPVGWPALTFWTLVY